MEFEDQYVKNTYEDICNDFSKTRYKIWPIVEQFLNKFDKNLKFLEIGFGNAKNMMFNPKNFYGIDNCNKFIEIAKKKNLNVKLSDACLIDFDDNFFDVTISIAVIHHLSTYERRLKAINEMIRVTKPKGSMLLEIWAFENNNRAISQDILLPWKSNKSKILNRYYHFFKKDEIINLINNFKNVKIINVSNEKFNWIIEFIKIY